MTFRASFTSYFSTIDQIQHGNHKCHKRRPLSFHGNYANKTGRCKRGSGGNGDCCQAGGTGGEGSFLLHWKRFRMGGSQDKRGRKWWWPTQWMSVKSHKDKNHHDVDVSVGAGEGKNLRNVTEKWLMVLALQKTSENVKPVCTGGCIYGAHDVWTSTSWMQTLRDMMAWIAWRVVDGHITVHCHSSNRCDSHRLHMLYKPITNVLTALEWGWFIFYYEVLHHLRSDRRGKQISNKAKCCRRKYMGVWSLNLSWQVGSFNITHHGGPIDDQKHSEEETSKLILDTKSPKEEFSHFSAISQCYEHKKSRKDQEGD